MMDKYTLASLFEPQGKKEMMLLYPELKNVKEFEPLDARELRMTWYIGSPFSKFRVRLTDRNELVKQAVEICYSQEQIRRNAELERLYKGKGTAKKYDDAIKRWATFNISVRLRMNFIANAQLDAIEAAAYLSDDEMAKMTPPEFAQWATAQKTNLALMPELLRIIESGHGVKVKTELEPDEQTVEHQVKVSIDDLDD
jgi:hypothetical protein